MKFYLLSVHRRVSTPAYDARSLAVRRSLVAADEVSRVCRTGSSAVRLWCKSCPQGMASNWSTQGQWYTPKHDGHDSAPRRHRVSAIALLQPRDSSKRSRLACGGALQWLEPKEVCNRSTTAQELLSFVTQSTCEPFARDAGMWWHLLHPASTAFNTLRRHRLWASDYFTPPARELFEAPRGSEFLLHL